MLIEILNFALQLPIEDRRYQFVNSNRAHFLDKWLPVRPDNPNMYNLRFESCSHNTLPDLLHSQKGTVRPNTREKLEGDIRMSHFALRFARDAVYLLAEERAGLSVDSLIVILQEFADKYYHSKSGNRPFIIEKHIVVAGNFDEVLDDMSSVQTVWLTVDKSVLSATTLERIARKNHTEVADKVQIRFKAKRRGNAKRDIEGFSRNKPGDVHRITVEGKDAQGKLSRFDDGRLFKTDIVQCEMDSEKNVILSSSMFQELNRLLAGIHT